MNNRIDGILAEVEGMQSKDDTVQPVTLPRAPKVCFSGRTYQELQTASDIQAFDFAVKGMFAMGEVTMVVADAKLGKTWLGFQLAVCASKGFRFLDQEVRQMRVLYVDMEMGTFDEKQRSRAIARELGVSSEDLNIAFIAGDEQETTPTLDNLEEGLAGFLEGKGWAFEELLLIVDTFGEVACDIEENTASETRSAISGLRKLARNRNCAVVVFHHTTKDGDVYRGSSAIRGAVDNLLFMRWASKKEKKIAKVETNKPFVVLYDDARRRRCPFETVHLCRSLIDREAGDGLHREETADVSDWDGFIWKSLGPVGKEHASPDNEAATWADGADDDELPPGVESGTEDEEGMLARTGKEERAAQVIGAFQYSTMPLPRKELESAYMKETNLGRESAKKAVGEAIELGLIEKTGGGQRAPYGLTEAGRAELERQSLGGFSRGGGFSSEADSDDDGMRITLSDLVGQEDAIIENDLEGCGGFLDGQSAGGDGEAFNG